MQTDPKLLATESMKLEQNVAALYKIFSNICSEDAGFWTQLASEELNHAALIKSGIEFFMDQGMFPNEMLVDSLDVLREANRELMGLIARCSINLPSRETAFQTALKIELSAGEAHFQNMMSSPQSLKAVEVFKQLNADDKDHAARIRAYIKNNGINVSQ
jgi:ferritin